MFAQMLVITIAVLWTLIVVTSAAGQDVPEPKAVPRLQIVPQPYGQASFQRDAEEITRYHFAAGLERPFLFPVIGPSGRSLTRMGHPHDPQSHSHHNSIWMSHTDVGGVDFWSDRRLGIVRHKRIVKYEDQGETSYLVAENEWVDKDGKVLLNETRRVSVTLLEGREWLLVLDSTFTTRDRPVALGKTPFGFLGVRMARTIGVNDGGGRIRNSEGGVNEKEIFWKKARWVDYCGPVADGKIEGIALFDHPGNPNHPLNFHVRNDGWMGASLTLEGPREITPDHPLHLRYGLYVHADMKPTEEIDNRWKDFAQMP
ncbi:MAG: PmoA family protein [Sedimentisphaerales bacterium]|nr:PmoA family protein [Sedimentisphaerales bacterium]